MSKPENKYAKHISTIIMKRACSWHYMEITGPSLTQISE